MKLPKRKPTRVKEFDYSTNGYYFITICTKDRKTILSNIIVGLTNNARPYEENQGNNAKQGAVKKRH